MSNNILNTDNPLVSVVVVTYNSAKTVVETLDSIKTQTYPNIELIVSDDCSKDNTIDVVQQWFIKNASIFVHTELVTTDNNTGVSGNLNRGIHKSHGEWIKSIAGDDLLIPTAIEEYVRYVQNQTEKIRMCVCDVEPFAEDGEVPQSFVEKYHRFFKLESEPYDKQRRRVMTQLVFVGPAYFHSRELFDEIGGYSDKYGCAEEWPFVYKVIYSGNRIYTLDKKLVRYRVSTHSLCNSRDNNGLGSQRVFEGMYKHYFDRSFKDLLKEGSVLTAWHYALFFWSHRLEYHIKNPILRRIVVHSIMFFSPIKYKRKLLPFLSCNEETD